MSTLIQDVRYCLRTLIAQPVFAVVAIVALAIGIGANTAIFSVVNAVLLRSLPYASPERLVVLYHDYRSTNFRASVSVPGFLDYRERKDVFEDLAAVLGWSANLTGQDEPERLQGLLVSSPYFHILGVRPMLGRDFRGDEDARGSNHVVVLSNGLWKRRFGANAGVIGQTLTINGESYSVIGVLPDVWFPSPAEIFSPIAFRPDQVASIERRNEYLSVIGRLRDGVTYEQARNALESMSNNLRAQYYNPRSGWAIGMDRWQELMVRSIRPALVVLQIAVLFVLLIACANVANLLLARSTKRRKEIAVRTALGATRQRLIRLLLTESLILAMIGASLGMLAASITIRVLRTTERQFSITEVQPGGIPRLQSVGIDMNVFAFTFLISVGSAAIFGLAPAMQISRTSLSETLKETARGGGTSSRMARIGQALVVAEFACALILLIGAGLLIRSFIRVQQVHTGFQSQGVLTARFSPPVTKYPRESLGTFAQKLADEIAAQPGVAAVGMTNVLPLSGAGNQASFDVEGLNVGPGEPEPHSNLWMITPDYFRAMGIPLIRGRVFSKVDGPDTAPVVIIDEAIQAKYFPTVDPIGRRIGYGNPTRWREIVGVVGHVKNRALDQEDEGEVYLAHRQSPDRAMFVVVRSTTPSGAVLRAAVRDVDPDLPLFDVREMDALVSGALGDRRFSTSLIGIFAGLALLLASVGIYGVMAYSVAQRTHEIGLRMALGAERKTVLGMVLRQAGGLAVCGTVIGLAGAYGLTRLMTNMLFQVSPTDLATYAGIASLLTATALAASYIPARRAASVDPVVALRSE